MMGMDSSKQIKNGDKQAIDTEYLFIFRVGVATIRVGRSGWVAPVDSPLHLQLLFVVNSVVAHKTVY